MSLEITVDVNALVLFFPQISGYISTEGLNVRFCSFFFVVIIRRQYANNEYDFAEPN